VERLQQSILRDENLQTLQMKKPENRICFRCEKSGHIAKNCRSRPLQKHQSRQIRQHHPLMNQHFKKKLKYQNLRNIRYNPLIYHTRDNRQKTTRRPKQTLSPNILTSRHNITFSKSLCQDSSRLQESSQKTSLKNKINQEH